jgi:hypothetical protein
MQAMRRTFMSRVVARRSDFRIAGMANSLAAPLFQAIGRDHPTADFLTDFRRM